MKMLLLAAVIFFQLTLIGSASSFEYSNVEKIDLNLKDQEIAVTFLGLGDGEATLIQGSNGENILINTGGEETSKDLTEILKTYGVKKISTIIITNRQNLFVDQLTQIIPKYNIKKLISTPEITNEVKNMPAPFIDVEVIPWKEGTSQVLFPDLLAEVLFAGNSENEGIDFTLQFFKHRIFLMTSSSDHVEENLLKKPLDDVTIFKVPNWAKEDSLSEKLIQYVNPQISILFESEQHQPDPNIIYDLQDTWSEVFFTKKHGTITIKFTENNYEVFTFPVEKEDYS
ncbi:beta-lactamase superfamily II metal-dependent hydrolase [Neobacillus niacini]|jgi:beta-lactamase superfamily II metal-dependent hydrolase|uniref:ATP-dependent DNA helicase n=1 Tax=Neobacillus niacini TaxID=86668 RepID=UPI002786E039|nr:ATP-dependent DNA helicase [Neobacillus niacini]MDQ1001748.1 beta-lactamase superfamily II metal-dependent hydrolase [Neobacillus niacini]